MYSRFQIALKYLQFYLNASNGRGHGIHSPFVFEFITHVLNSNQKSPHFHTIEKHRKNLLQDETFLDVRDLGAGSNQNLTNKRRVKDIASGSLKSVKYAQLLYRIAQYYRCKRIVELGTSLGTTSAYLSLAGNCQVISLEGAASIAGMADQFFKKNNFHNIKVVGGDFNNTIPLILHEWDTIDLVFVDGNHREEPTINYFNAFLPKAHNDSIFIFDDIHWSAEMERAWNYITDHEQVALSIDLFFIGIVFFKKEFLEKQHFSIRF